MTRTRSAIQLLGVLLPIIIFSTQAQNATTPAASMRTYSTIQTIGVEWDLTGDANHNATCAVQYRKQGATAWKQGLNLFRVDNRTQMGVKQGQACSPGYTCAIRHFNMFAGSIFFLEAGATYEVKMDISDADGGSTSRTVNVTTQPFPVLPTSGRTFHVAPGTGGGDGSQQNPFKGFAAAEAVAQPGDIFLVHTGSYGGYTFTKAGTSSKYIVWKAAGDGEVSIDHGRGTGYIFFGYGMLFVSGDYIWIEGFTLKRESNDVWDDSPKIPAGIVVNNAAKSAVIQKNVIRGLSWGIWTIDATHCYIADNSIYGDSTLLMTSYDPMHMAEGIDLEATDPLNIDAGGHTVCHNFITHTADAISCGGYGAMNNIDIFENEIYNIFDDAVEGDGTYSNLRVWGNRVTNATSGVSFQPQWGAPWYIFRNQFVNAGWPMKWNTGDRTLIANNTIVEYGRLQGGYAHHFLQTLTRNNLWIVMPQFEDDAEDYLWLSTDCGPEPTGEVYCSRPTYYVPNWQTDVDYDGFSWVETADSPFKFYWYVNGTTWSAFTNNVNFANAVGIEKNSKRVYHNQIFQSYSFPEQATPRVHARGGVYVSPFLVNPHYLVLKSGSGAIDAGQALPNINDGYTGTTADLGAYECGQPVPHYGPRHIAVKGGAAPVSPCAPASEIRNEQAPILKGSGMAFVRATGRGGITIRWTGPAEATAEIYSLSGARIASYGKVGNSGIKWNPAKSASGIYLVKVESGSITQTAKIFCGR